MTTIPLYIVCEFHTLPSRDKSHRLDVIFNTFSNSFQWTSRDFVTAVQQHAHRQLHIGKFGHQIRTSRVMFTSIHTLSILLFPSRCWEQCRKSHVKRWQLYCIKFNFKSTCVGRKNLYLCMDAHVSVFTYELWSVAVHMFIYICIVSITCKHDICANIYIYIYTYTWYNVVCILSTCVYVYTYIHLFI